MKLRNIAIIAHVDHGKTTLVDALFRQSGMFRDNEVVSERALDVNDLEKERGITILSKCTSVMWKGVRINIVDTPGHSDFGGEVERVLSMVDGVLVLVDSAEGPMPQTKFVVGKALALGLKPVVVVNKMDRPDARADAVHTEVFDLFAALEADDDQLDFPALFASGRDGWASETSAGGGTDLAPLFDMILETVPAPVADADAPFSMRVTTLEGDPFLGRVLTGRIHSGWVQVNETLRGLSREGEVLEDVRITKLLGFRGLKRVPLKEAGAGDIVAIAGPRETSVADTLCTPATKTPLPARPVDPPTLAMTFSLNDSPLAGREGSRLTGRMIRDRLLREAESNVALSVREMDKTDTLEVAGRGELQLGVLIETMRREGFELTIGPPRVLMREEKGKTLEPFEEVVIDVDEAYSGVVMEEMSRRRGKLADMRSSGGGKTRLVFHAPTRGLVGYHSAFLSDTRGTGVMHRLFLEMAPYSGEIETRRRGVLISLTAGTAIPYALWKLEERGTLFVAPGDPVYPGMIVGENARGQDLEVNPVKTKQLTNIRAAGKDDAVELSPPRKMSLEAALAYLNDDERLEVTPESLRLRKALLDMHERKKANRK